MELRLCYLANSPSWGLGPRKKKRNKKEVEIDPLKGCVLQKVLPQEFLIIDKALFFSFSEHFKVLDKVVRIFQIGFS